MCMFEHQLLVIAKFTLSFACDFVRWVELLKKEILVPYDCIFKIDCHEYKIRNN